jgi:NAD(P)-dependent dehydrogenase (short-subunit alcohol dehydrogenase family)
VPTVLITGSSSGFGLLTAVTLAQGGWVVVASMRNLERRAALDAAVAAAGVGDRVHVVPLDVADPASVEQGVKEAEAIAGGGLDAVVCNAGIALAGLFEDVPDDELRRVMETNFFGVTAMARACLPAMRQRRRGRFLVVSSNSAFAGAPGVSAYHASKWAVEGWAESIAYEVAPFGIDVVLVEPGSFKTEIWGNSPSIAPAGSAYAAAHPLLESGKATLQRWGRDPQQVADVIARALEVPRRRLRLRYPVGPDAKAEYYFVRRFVPVKAYMAVVRRVLGLNRFKP